MPQSDGSIIIDTRIDQSGFDKGISALKSSSKKAAVAIGVGIGAAAALFVRLGTAAEDAATSDKRLSAIAESMGLFGNQTGKVVDRLKDYASKVSVATGVDDDYIKAGQAKLLTFKDLASSAGEVGGAFDRATQAALDLEKAGFGDMAGNAVQLGKALQDPVKGLTALSRSGVTFTQAEKDMIAAMVESGDVAGAQNMILSAIETQVGGTAAATAKASDKMKTAFGEMEEAAGAVLLPSFEQISGGITKMLSGDIVGGSADLVAGIETAANSLAAALPTVLPVIVRALVTLITSLSRAVPVILPPLMAAFIDGFKLLVQQLPVVLPELIAAFVEIMDMLMLELPGIIEMLVPALVEGIVLLANALAMMAPTLIPQIVNLVLLLAAELTKQSPTLTKAALVLIGGLAVGIGNGIKTFLAGWPKKRDEVIKALKDKLGLDTLKKAGEDLVKGLWNGVGDKFEWLTGKLKKFAKDVTKELKAFFKIKSPSRLFADEIGANLGLGIGVGFEDSVGTAFARMRNTLASEVGRFSASPGPVAASAAASGGSSVQTINFNAPVRTYSETVRAVRDIERGLAW